MSANPQHPRLPRPRGPLSHHALALLRGDRPRVAAPDGRNIDFGDIDLLGDDDLHLALYCLYELHYRGFDGVDDELEWDPTILAFRRGLERAFESALRAQVDVPDDDPDRVRDAVRSLIDASTGPSLSAHIATHGTLQQVRELAVHRSAYQLKEADPHTWAIPRLDGPAKAALIRIQSDEYGFGHHADMHATLFGDTMRALGLDDTYGAYLDLIPGSTLATVNLVTMFGLHRRLRAAAVGHLTVFEMTSVIPMSRYASGLARLGLGAGARKFYDVHVAADAVHEVVALEEMAWSLVRDAPALAADLVFGAAAVLEVERRFSEAVLRSWAAGMSSLREDMPAVRRAA